MILIVDDVPENLRLLSATLTQAGYEVRSAISGSVALMSAAVEPPDLILLDITMPHIDGIECIEHLIAIDPDVMILVVSALNDKATGMEALEKGAMGFINKPFTQTDIIQALDALVED